MCVEIKRKIIKTIQEESKTSRVLELKILEDKTMSTNILVTGANKGKPATT